MGLKKGPFSALKGGFPHERMKGEKQAGGWRGSTENMIRNLIESLALGGGGAVFMKMNFTFSTTQTLRDSSFSGCKGSFPEKTFRWRFSYKDIEGIQV